MQMSEQPGKSRVQFEHPHDDRCGPRVGRPGAKRNLGQMGGGGVPRVSADREVNPVVSRRRGLITSNKLHLHFDGK